MQGYASGDEAKMLERHLSGTSARIGVGANRTAVAASIFERHGYMKFENTLYSEKLSNPYEFGSASENGKVGVAILDDGMQVFICIVLFLICIPTTFQGNHVVVLARFCPFRAREF